MGKAYLFERDEWEFILAQGQVADIVLPVLMAVEPKDQSGLTEPGMEAANEVGVNLRNGYNGDLTSREAGSVGGQMVKKMIDSYKAGNMS